MPIDEIVDRDSGIAAIHLDVEGYEQQVLEGALETLGRCRPMLVLETLPTDEWVRRHLFPLGYAVSGKVDGNIVLLSAS